MRAAASADAQPGTALNALLEESTVPVEDEGEDDDEEVWRVTLVARGECAKSAKAYFWVSKALIELREEPLDPGNTTPPALPLCIVIRLARV